MARCVAVVLALAAFVAPTAIADGLPVLGVDVGSSGVAAPNGSIRYVTIPAGASTIVERVHRNGGEIIASTFYPGTFTIPAVAYDRSAGGLSGDRNTLVLIEPRTSFPRRTTTLLVLNARTLTYRALVKLRGDFSFDAVSPAGRRIFLIQYTSSFDPTRYRVRSYDVSQGRLESEAVIDPRATRESMRGNPLSRAASTDGRWAYTLYDGNGKPFLHALDTEEAQARCIDLNLAAGTVFSQLRLRMTDDGRAVNVSDRDQVLVTLDTRTLSPRTTPSSGMLRTPAFAILGLLLAGTLAVLTRHRWPSRRQPVPID